MKTLHIIAALFPLVLAASPAAAKSRVARCVITSGGEKTYTGPCSFSPDGKGSFYIDPVGRKRFSPDVTTISVSLIEPNLAEVRGLTTSGINSRWGEARRFLRLRLLKL